MRVVSREHAFPTAATKRCRRCDTEKPSAEFPPKPEMRDGLNSWCRVCYREYGSRWQRALRLAQPKRVHRTDRDQYLRTKYKLTAAEVDQLIEKQHGCCLTCGQSFGPDLQPCVDHCHTTGVVRGILCRNCNSILGLAGEDPVRLEALAMYIDPRSPFSRCAVADVAAERRRRP